MAGKETHQNWDERVRKRCEMVAGPTLSIMLKSQEATEAYLDSNDKKLRVAAFLLMLRYWPPSENFAKRCETLAAEDPNEGIRAAATGFLGDYYKSSNNARIGLILARIVHNNEETSFVRLNAYLALLKIPENPVAESMSSAVALDFNFSSQKVDWPFVDSFLEKDR